jgi:HEAT repeat protein
MPGAVPRRDRLRETLARLARVREDPSSEASRVELRRALARESSPAVAKAAAIAGEAGLTALVPDLVAAFERFLRGPARTDPGCVAKTGVVEALLRLDQGDEGVLLRALRHVQMEPVWGGQVDTAVDLRGAAALGLARTSRPDVLAELAELLADPEPPARVSAARAIASHGRPAGIPLLRHKALTGDEEPRVVTECLLGLLHLDPRGSLPFVAALLDPNPVPGRPARDRAECAAAALGESRLKEAIAVLREWYPKASARRLGRTALRALAALRRDEAFDFLLALVREGDANEARDAVAALAEHRDETIRARLREAAAGRPAVAEAIERALAAEGG